MENQIWYDVNGTPTKLTDIRYGSFHYHADIGSSGKVRLGGVCASYIEFDYLLSNGVTFNVGDALQYKQFFPEIDNSFAPALTDLVWDGGTFYITSIDDNGKTCHVTAYDSVSKLDVDFSAYLKSIKGNFPKSVRSLLNDVSTVSGVTFDLSTTFQNFLGSVIVNYFYADGISCRDVVRAAAEMCCFYVRATDTANELKFTYGGGYTNTPWEQSYRYIICPDDGTYKDPNNNTAINVWYKENGLRLGEEITEYDGTIVYSADGTPAGDTTATDPYKFYFASSLFVGTKSIGTSVRSSIQQALTSIFSTHHWMSGKIELFPFRFPFKVGQLARVVAPDGRKLYFPIMSLDLSESEVVIESYSDKTVGAEAQNGVGSGGEDRSIALDVRVTELESQKIDGYTLVNFASVSAGTISTYNSRSFSDYILLVAEWFVNDSIRATTMFRRVDFENAPYVSMFYVDSANTQRWCELSYVDDTTLSITASSNASGNIALFGIALTSS